ncbi:MAG: uracil phosphoribosyltransferase [Melioribacteraceae bacterium]|nr:uracil phosphoribosyltransferase [Melioribacteraceae bacterium]
MKNLIKVQSPLIKRDITILRNIDTNTEQFRNALSRIAFVMASEISKSFEVAEIDVQTPLEVTTGYIIKKHIVLVPVLRAGLSMVQPFLDMIPNARVGHIGLKRDENTLLPIDYYYKTPKELPKAKTILLDPMLATGGSAVVAFNYLKDQGANDCILACLIAAPEGVEKMQREHPEIPVYTASLDKGLNSQGYILPGLGDAGDRTFGTF